MWPNGTPFQQSGAIGIEKDITPERAEILIRAQMMFKEITLRVYRENLVGPVPAFPAQIEQSINDYLKIEPVKDAALREKSIPQYVEVPPNTEVK